jgi:hypothetical protein
MADLLKARWREPALPPPPQDRKAVGGLFIGPAELMPTLESIRPQLHGPRYLLQPSQVEDDEARIGGAIVVEQVVQHGRVISAGTLRPASTNSPAATIRVFTDNIRDVILWWRWA